MIRFPAMGDAFPGLQQQSGGTALNQPSMLALAAPASRAAPSSSCPEASQTAEAPVTAPNWAAELLEALMQLPEAGVAVLCAASARLRAAAESAAVNCRFAYDHSESAMRSGFLA